MDRKKRHRDQVRKQIILPAIFIGVFFVLFAGTLIYFSFKDPFLAKKLSDYSITSVLILAILVNGLMLFILTVAIRKIAEWRREISKLADSSQDQLASLKSLIDEMLDKVTEPIIAAKSWNAAAKKTFRRKK